MRLGRSAACSHRARAAGSPLPCSHDVTVRRGQLHPHGPTRSAARSPSSRASARRAYLHDDDGLYALAALPDGVVYPSPGGSPLYFPPYTASGKPQYGGFRFGPTPAWRS